MAKYRTGNILGSVADMENLSRGVWGRNGFFSTTACAATPGTGLQVAVTILAAGEAVCNGTRVAGTAAANVNLDAAHATLNRRDIIYYDHSTPGFGKLSGTPARNRA